jgi:hypothetical protein
MARSSRRRWTRMIHARPVAAVGEQDVSVPPVRRAEVADPRPPCGRAKLPEKRCRSSKRRVGPTTSSSWQLGLKRVGRCGTSLHRGAAELGCRAARTGAEDGGGGSRVDLVRSYGKETEGSIGGYGEVSEENVPPRDPPSRWSDWIMGGTGGGAAMGGAGRNGFRELGLFRFGPTNLPPLVRPERLRFSCP